MCTKFRKPSPLRDGSLQSVALQHDVLGPRGGNAHPQRAEDGKPQARALCILAQLVLVNLARSRPFPHRRHVKSAIQGAAEGAQSDSRPMQSRQDLAGEARRNDGVCLKLVEWHCGAPLARCFRRRPRRPRLATCPPRPPDLLNTIQCWSRGANCSHHRPNLAKFGPKVIELGQHWCKWSEYSRILDEFRQNSPSSATYRPMLAKGLSTSSQEWPRAVEVAEIWSTSARPQPTWTAAGPTSARGRCRQEYSSMHAYMYHNRPERRPPLREQPSGPTAARQ